MTAGVCVVGGMEAVVHAEEVVELSMVIDGAPAEVLVATRERAEQEPEEPAGQVGRQKKPRSKDRERRPGVFIYGEADKNIGGGQL